MRSIIRLLLCALLATIVSARPVAAQVLRVVTTTADLGSLAQEVGGDKVTVVALAKAIRIRTLSIRNPASSWRSAAPTCSS